VPAIPCQQDPTVDTGDPGDQAISHADSDAVALEAEPGLGRPIRRLVEREARQGRPADEQRLFAGTLTVASPGATVPTWPWERTDRPSIPGRG
jgi:hypothetical protein